MSVESEKEVKRGFGEFGELLLQKESKLDAETEDQKALRPMLSE